MRSNPNVIGAIGRIAYGQSRISSRPTVVVLEPVFITGIDQYLCVAFSISPKSQLVGSIICIMQLYVGIIGIVTTDPVASAGSHITVIHISASRDNSNGFLTVKLISVHCNIKPVSGYRRACKSNVRSKY